MLLSFKNTLNSSHTANNMYLKYFHYHCYFYSTLTFSQLEETDALLIKMKNDSTMSESNILNNSSFYI